MNQNVPNGWERRHHAVDIDYLAITTESNDLPLANIHLGLRKGKVGGATMLAIATNHPGRHRGAFRDKNMILANEAGHV